MISKAIIAHEIGHAISAFAQDSGYIPTLIELSESKNCLAACYMDDFKMAKPGPYGKTKGICDLGGIFGELIYQGWWNPWGARLDLDNFISSNPKLVELDNWLWVDTEEGSFHYLNSYPTTKERRDVKVDSHSTFRNTPYIWEAYCDFCDRIDKEEFLQAVNEVYKNKTESIEGKDMAALGKRIIL